MTLELTVRDKTYKVEVDSRGTFYTRVGEDDGSRQISAETLKGLEQKLTTATRIQTAKVALQFKRLGRKGTKSKYSRETYRGDETMPWEVIVVTVRGVNEHTGHLMVTWPDGVKGDDVEVGRYSRDSHIYFPTTMADEEILSRRKLIDESEKWFETNAVDVISKAKAEVAKALGE